MSRPAPRRAAGARRRSVLRPAARASAAGDHRAAHPRPPPILRRRHTRDPPAAGRDRPPRLRYLDVGRQRRRGAARGRRRRRRRRCGDGGLGADGVRRDPAAGASLRGQPADGILPVRECGRGGGACAGAMGPAARGGRRFRCAPRQRHAVAVRGRPRSLLRIEPPVPLLSRHGRGGRDGHCRQRRQCAACAGFGERCLPERLVARAAAGPRPIRAGAADRLGRV